MITLEVATSEDLRRKVIIVNFALAGIMGTLNLILSIAFAADPKCGYSHNFFAPCPWFTCFTFVFLICAMSHRRAASETQVKLLLVIFAILSTIFFIYDILVLDCAGKNTYNDFCHVLSANCMLQYIVHNNGAGGDVANSVFNMMFLIVCVVWQVFYWKQINRLLVPLPVEMKPFYYFVIPM